MGIDAAPVWVVGWCVLFVTAILVDCRRLGLRRRSRDAVVWRFAGNWSCTTTWQGSELGKPHLALGGVVAGVPRLSGMAPQLQG